MKRIVGVFFFFFFLSSVVLLVFVYQTKKSQDLSSQAKDSSQKQLGLLIDDCNVMFNSECQPPGGLGNPAIMNSIINTILNQLPNKALARYKEKHLPIDYPDLFNPDEQTTMELSVADILTRLAVRKHVNYKVMIALLDAQGEVKHPYGLSELSVLEEFNSVADYIVESMQAPPTTAFLIGETPYTLDSNINKGSATVYGFLASTSKNPLIFQQKLDRFQQTWRQLYNESPLSDQPNYLMLPVEKPLPTPFDQAPPPIQP